MITQYFKNNTKKSLVLLTGIFFVVLFFSYTHFFQPCVFFDEKNIKKQSEKWEDCIDIWGGKVSYAFFKQANKIVPNQYKHINAHLFGNALYRTSGMEKAFRVCDLAYFEGCVHEITYLAFLERKPSSVSDLSEIAETCRKIFPNMYSVACLHSFGHGLVALVGYELNDLKQALDFCSDYFPDIDGKESAQKRGSDYLGSECPQGVFMEYMEYYERNASPELGPRSLDPQNIYAPCDTLKNDKFKMPCYLRLAAYLWFNSISNADIISKYNKMISWCRNIPEAEYYYACVSGVRMSTFFIPETSSREKKKIKNLVDDALQSVKIFSTET